MDVATTSITVTNAWALLQLYRPVNARKAAREIGKELPAAVGKVWGALKSKFDSK